MNCLFRAARVLLTLGGVILPFKIAAAADKISVIATFSVIGDMVTNVGRRSCRAGHDRRLLTATVKSMSPPQAMCQRSLARGSCS